MINSFMPITLFSDLNSLDKIWLYLLKKLNSLKKKKDVTTKPDSVTGKFHQRFKEELNSRSLALVAGATVSAPLFQGPNIREEILLAQLGPRRHFKKNQIIRSQ